MVDRMGYSSIKKKLIDIILVNVRRLRMFRVALLAILYPILAPISILCRIDDEDIVLKPLKKQSCAK